MYKMYRNTLLLFLSLLFISLAHAEENRFHRVPALEGDNVHTLLKRYSLHNHACNFEQFYKLNELTKKSFLYENKQYYIPVLIYRYNGVSIKTTIGIDTWEQALRIKRYNDRLLKNNLRRKSLVASNILWVPYHETHCSENTNTTSPAEVREEIITSIPEAGEPETIKVSTKKEKPKEKYEEISEDVLKKLNKNSGVRKFPIFGPKYAYVPLQDNSLRGKVYYLVGGHGGPDPGAVGKAGRHKLCEDEYAYDVTLRLARKLIERGALVYMITRDQNDGLRDEEILPCDIDEYCYGNYKIPRNQKKRLYQRSDAVNKLYERHKKQGIKDQYCVVIHIDSRNRSANTDVFFYYFPGSDAGKKTALNMHKTFRRKYKIHRKKGNYTGTVTARDLHMIREPKPTSVFIELGNIQNKYDQKRFLQASNREALAKWLYEGLILK